jgi:hypothetical protein
MRYNEIPHSCDGYHTHQGNVDFVNTPVKLYIQGELVPSLSNGRLDTGLSAGPFRLNDSSVDPSSIEFS